MGLTCSPPSLPLCWVMGLLASHKIRCFEKKKKKNCLDLKTWPQLRPGQLMDRLPVPSPVASCAPTVGSQCKATSCVAEFLKVWDPLTITACQEMHFKFIQSCL